jgi:prolyl oligopeptidase
MSSPLSDLSSFSLKYPESYRGDHVDDYHGTKVADPYRWLEDPDSAQTQAWVKAQNELTFDYLSQIPARNEIRERITQLWNYEKYGIPFQEGDRYFYFKNDGLQNQSVLYTLQTLEDTQQVLLDPNLLSTDGTIALSGLAVSRNGRYLAYGLSRAGSDWVDWQVKEITTGEELSDRLHWVKFSGVSWTTDNLGFFYSRYDPPDAQSKLEEVNYYQKLYYHRLGTPQAADELIYHRPDQKEWGFAGSVTESGHYLIINVWKGSDSQNLIFYKDLREPRSPIVELISEFEASFDFIDQESSRFWLITDLDAPRKRVIAIDLDQPSRDRWQEIIPESLDTLEGVALLNHQFVADYLSDAYSKVKRFALDGQYQGEIKLPGIGSIGGFDGKRSDRQTFYSFTSFTTPSTLYRYDFSTGESTLLRKPAIAFNTEDFITTQVFYSSPDGTSIPMFITHKRDLERKQPHPTYLYGYGGFNISLTPSFSIGNIVWMERGGILAIPNLRGGGEYGEDWHQAGTKLKKQTVFDDFIASAEWLVDQGYTSPSKLAIAGGSNGGLLVGACLSQRPELFAAALPAVGVLDMLRFHLFTIGWAWCAEYGCSDNAEEFEALYRYSPLHNLKVGINYPATLITTADHDDRVVPAHSFKFAAALQSLQSGSNPVLIRIETQAGHGAGKPTTKLIEESADKWAFLLQVLQG